MQEYGYVIDSIFTGLIGLITWIPRALIMALLTGVNTLTAAFAKLGMGEISGYGTISSNLFVTPFHVFFNKIAILDVNFLDLNVTGTVLTFRTAVAGWYYTMRLIACMILVVILVYIGIRMAISTIASEKAMYKKMLVDWVTSLVLLFLLHYIIIFILACNSALVKALENICQDMDLTGFIGQLTAQALGLETSSAIAAMILYGIIIGQTVSFIFAYVKRMLTTGFLIMIAPLITITYSIDKIGDGKSQALNTWLKEFSFNILIQPFHCILFASFASVAFDIIGVGTWTAGSSLAEMVLAVACIQFIKTGEALVRKIFNFGEAGTTFAQGAGMAVAALGYGAKAGTAVGAGVAKTRNLIASNEKINKSVKGLASKADKLTKGVSGQMKQRATNKRNNAIDKKMEQQFGGKEKLEKFRNSATDKEWEDARKDAEKAVDSKNIGKKLTGNIKQKMTNKRNDAIDKKMEQQFGGKEGLEKFRKGATDKEWEEARKKAGNALDTEKHEKQEKRREKVKNITGATGKFIEKNGQKIVSGTFAAVSGLVGLGAGDLSTAMTASQFGSGLVKGYMSNTNKTLQKEVSGAAQSVANMNADNEDFDMEAKTYAVQATSENGGFDKVEEKLDQILQKLEALTGNQKNNFNADIRAQLKTNPGGLDMNFLNSLADKYNVPEDQREATLNGMKQFATLAAEANYARTINTATSAGRKIEDVASVAAGGVVTQNVTVAGPDATEVANELKGKIPVEVEQNGTVGVRQEDIDELNMQTNNINRNMNRTINNPNNPINNNGEI